ncbi:MAG: bile acid:sodium symporter [Alcaligenaceae bacterium]|jgi:sodium/bile acid cotransporter 7|nr:bile acid:sodium symporter [Alcaligenaceae bacterium]
MRFNFKRLIPDQFTTLLTIVVIIATLLPAHGQGEVVVDWSSKLAIGLLFFLHGARLSRQAIYQGIMHWRIHIVIFGITFVVFPLIGILLKPVLEPLMTPTLYLGFLYLCMLPGTVQSAIAFTSIARGNLAAAICNASASSIVGIFVTPMLVALILSDFSDQIPPISLMSVVKIIFQLFVPFAVGHLLRPYIGEFLLKNKLLVRFVDQGSILLVVYAAFSHAVNEGLWHETPLSALIAVFLVSALILALSLGASHFLGKALGFNLPDRITILFCGSKKSLASGLPMAQIIFAGMPIGAIILPLMIFHQLQLMVCATIATRLSKRPMTPEEKVAERVSA